MVFALLFIACAFSISICTSTGMEALKRARSTEDKFEKNLCYATTVTVILVEVFVTVSFWLKVLGVY